MIDRLFPRTIDNSYRGAKAALWLLGLVAAVKLVMGLNCIVNGRHILSSVDGIPLATYPADAAQTVVAMFAIWAWGLFLISSFAVLTLVRYRSMTSLSFALLLLEHAGRKLILQSIPIARSTTAPAAGINTALLALMAAGLLLSLWRKGGWRSEGVHDQAA
ncbi:MAG TPA: hypothetical protein VFL80_10765 [Thermoanaerobaculia bacterium]|nr:hypothetical protein [Thermoanaerobaculia bacterium]